MFQTITCFFFFSVPFILPSVPRDLLDRLANERLEEKNATLEHKKEREQMYDELNAKQAEKIFQTCSRPPQRKQRPLFHCQVKDFLIASGGEASPNEFKDYFGKMVTKNPSICLAFAMGLDMVSRYNSTTDMFQLKDHLRWWSDRTIASVLFEKKFIIFSYVFCVCVDVDDVCVSDDGRDRHDRCRRCSSVRAFSNETMMVASGAATTACCSWAVVVARADAWQAMPV